MTRKTRKTPRMGQDVGSDLCFGVSSRDRIAPDFTIRQLVWPIVALQRRVRFLARLAGFCRNRCHQRRARRAERASFSVFVSNLYFRVPRLRQRGERALTGPCGRREKRPPERPRIEVGATAVQRGLASSGPGAARASLMSIFAQDLDPGLRPGAWHPVSGRCFPMPTGNPNRRPQRHPPRALVSPRSNGRGSPRPPRGSPGVQNNRPDIRKQSQERVSPRS